MGNAHTDEYEYYTYCTWCPPTPRREVEGSIAALVLRVQVRLQQVAGLTEGVREGVVPGWPGEALAAMSLVTVSPWSLYTACVETGG